MRPVTITGLAVVLLTLAGPPAYADDVPPGYDLLRTVSMTQDFYWTEWLPAGFFGPGSDVFAGTVTFRGDPIPTFLPCGTLSPGLTDTILRRVATAELPSIGAVDAIPIEMVALSLVSVSPITVTYHGGSDPETWDVRMGLSPYQVASGTMTITHSQPTGGTFQAQVFVSPEFVFTRTSDGAVRVKDFGLPGAVVNAYVATGVWAHDPGPASCASCAGTAFFPGISPSGDIVAWQFAELPSAVHTLTVACPSPPLATEATTWGAMKALYR